MRAILLILGGGAVWIIVLLMLLRLTTLIEQRNIRLIVTTIVTVLFLGPGALVGHGFAPVPLLIMFFLPDHWPYALGAFVAYSLIIMTILGVFTSKEVAAQRDPTDRNSAEKANRNDR